MDRQEACKAYLEKYPEDTYAEHFHHIVDDHNVETYWLTKAIADLGALAPTPERTRQIDFLNGLLLLPMPEGWEDEE